MFLIGKSLFNFELKHPLEIAFTENEQGDRQGVCWFYLTDSEYFIDLEEVKLFENSSQSITKYPLIGRFDDYQYSRHLEDLFEILPAISCPMPEDLYALVDTNEKRELLYSKMADLYLWDDDPIGEHQDAKLDSIINSLIYYGRLDTGHLRFRSDCQFFNINGDVIIQYNFIDEYEGIPVWSAGKGLYTLTYKKFICEIEDLLNRFFLAMDKQIETAIQVFNEREVEGSNLALEHALRKEYFYGILYSVKNNEYKNLIDWGRLREDLKYFMSKIKL